MKFNWPFRSEREDDMPFKKGCAFNKEVQDAIFNIYRNSNLGVLEYLVGVLPGDERAKDFLNKSRREK